MEASELQIGKMYIVNHSSGRTRFRLVEIRKVLGTPNRKATTRYIGIRVSTGREVTFKSAQKFIREANEFGI